MGYRVVGAALVLLIATPIGQVAAQTYYRYPPRVAAPYDSQVPGYYARAPRYYYRAAPRYYYYRDGETVVVPRGGRIYLREGYQARRYDPYPSDRPSARVAPEPYYEDGSPPRRQFRGRGDTQIVPDERVSDGDGRRRGGQTVEPSLVPDPRGAEEIAPRAQPQLTPQTPGRYAALPPARDPSGAELPRHLRRQVVDYPTKEPAGTIVVDTRNTYLYYVNGDGTAVRYGIGVGRDGFTWAGTEKVSRMAEWPDWYPPKEMLERQPHLPRMMSGGPTNPLGARALYLGNTLYRIHGTNEPATIGQFVSSGCIRLLNQDIEDLYNRVRVGTKVVVLSGGRRSPRSASGRR